MGAFQRGESHSQAAVGVSLLCILKILGSKVQHPHPGSLRSEDTEDKPANQASCSLQAPSTALSAKALSPEPCSPCAVGCS